MMGVQSIQTTGLPGADNANLYVRGQRSWRSGSPVAFVDGRLRSFSLIDPHEIESISVYKDAGSLSILGLRGQTEHLWLPPVEGKREDLLYDLMRS